MKDTTGRSAVGRPGRRAAKPQLAEAQKKSFKERARLLTMPENKKVVQTLSAFKWKKTFRHGAKYE